MPKKTIVMIHGFRGTHHGLALISKELQDFKVVVPDIPGFGEGDSLDTYSLDSYVAWLHSFIQKQNAQPILLGHSFGSIITAAYAAKYGNTIEKLILVNPIGASALQGPRKILTQLAVFYYWLGKKLPESLARAWLSTKPIVYIMSVTMAKTRERPLRKYIHKQHFTYFSRFHTSASVLEAFQTSIQHSVADVADDITTPTLLIAGAKDDITPIAVQRQLIKQFKNARLVEIESVGHLTHYETPVAVARAVQAFSNER